MVAFRDILNQLDSNEFSCQLVLSFDYLAEWALTDNLYDMVCFTDLLPYFRESFIFIVTIWLFFHVRYDSNQIKKIFN